MGNYIGIVLLAALAVVTVVLWRKGLLFGPGGISKHMCGCCNPQGFEPERHEPGDDPQPKKASR
jgi:hypothetical protein